MRAPFAKKISRYPSPSKSSSATPPLIVSSSGLSSVVPFSSTKVIPDRGCWFTSRIGEGTVPPCSTNRMSRQAREAYREMVTISKYKQPLRMRGRAPLSANCRQRRPRASVGGSQGEGCGYLLLGLGQASLGGEDQGEIHPGLQILGIVLENPPKQLFRFRVLPLAGARTPRLLRASAYCGSAPRAA